MQTFRVSCVAFARIRIDDGRYVLLLNAGSLRRSQRVLSPIGGALQGCTDGVLYLQDSLGATDFEGDDLRFCLPAESLEPFGAWFEGRGQRETSVIRELYEELCLEEKILKVGDLVGLREGYAFTQTHFAKTMRDVPVRNTCYFCEVFDVTLPAQTVESLQAAANMQSAALYIVTDGQIREGRAKDGTPISKTSRLLLD